MKDGIAKFTTDAQTSAALSASFGLQARIHLRAEAVVASVVRLYAELGAVWEAKAGLDAVACVVGECEPLATQLTNYIEYPKSEVPALTAAGAQIGLWAYVPYPQVYA